MTLLPRPVSSVAQRLSGVTSSPVRDLLALTERADVISFAGGLPAPELFDLPGLRAAFAKVLSDDARGRRRLQYAPTEGDPELRALVAQRLTRRGLPTSADDLLITTGSQQALALVATALVDPGAVVAVESPTYLAALQCFQLSGARVVPVASDAGGIDPDDLARVIHRERPAFLYLTPTFANPTGRTLSAERRTVVAGIAARSGTWIVEDDPYGELRYRGDHLPPLAAAGAAAGLALHLGSFSKIGAPGLRLGWLRSPAELRRPLAVAKQATDLHTSTVDQAAAATYLADSDLDQHVQDLCRAYRERRDAMLAALPGVTPPGTKWTDPDGGMFTWLELPRALDTSELLPRAVELGVAFAPGAPFFATEPDVSTLRLSFTTHPPQVIAEGMTRLGEALGGDSR
jgi:DNA-binding transcriptional MocR family regulator